jgi:hypothetical protein
MKKTELIKIISKALKKVTSTMQGHLGVEFIMKSRLKFEKWFQVELLKEFLVLTKNQSNFKIKNEYAVSTKIAKKGETIDLVILNNSIKFAAIELKIVPTNYYSVGFAKSTKGITDTIDEMISDLAKTINDNYIYSFSIGFMYPFPIDSNHRNNIMDFIKQENKLRAVGKLYTIDCQLSTTFNSRYYILTNK